jgi:diguanylate cyclase (GGDEF)-like protein
LQRQSSYRLYQVIQHGSWAGIFAHAGFIPLFHFLGHDGMAWFNVGSVLAWCCARWLNQRGRQSLAMTLLTLEVTSHAVCAVATVGWQSGFQYYLLPLVSFFTFNDRGGFRFAFFLSLGVVALLGGLYLFYHDQGPALDPSVEATLYVANLAIPICVLFISNYYYRHASTALEQRLDELASHDSLTGLLNRRRMLERLRERRAEFDRRQRPFALVMADIDHFKRINDTHGHDAGDKVLCELARTLSLHLREEDVLCRWGGEEFLLLLSEANLEATSVVAEKLRRVVEQHDFEVGGQRMPLTMTFGVSVYDGSQTLDQAIHSADEALYRGKATGRNRVEFGRGPLQG